MNKKCTRCGETKDYDQFYNRKKFISGKDSWCKCCCRKARIANKENNPEKYREYSKKGHAKHDKKYRERDRIKYRARWAVYDHLKSGSLIKPEKCSIHNHECEGSIEAHHTDYSKPLSVVWLCHLHHQRLHGRDCATVAPKE